MANVKLTVKQKLFVDEYLVDFIAVAAYKRAGYKAAGHGAEVNSSRMLLMPHIQVHIQQRMKDRARRTEITQDRVLHEIAAVGFAQAVDVARVVRKLDSDGSEYQAVEIVDTDLVPTASRTAIASVKQGQHGIEIKLHDKLKALELLGRHLGMFNDKIEHSGAVTVLSYEEQLKRLINGGSDDTSAS